jgi:hypothetical protein
MSIIIKIFAFILASPLLFLALPVILLGFVDVDFIIYLCAAVVSELIWILLLIAFAGPYLANLI